MKKTKIKIDNSEKGMRVKNFAIMITIKARNNCGKNFDNDKDKMVKHITHINFEIESKPWKNESLL